MDRTSIVVQGIRAICADQGSAGRPLLLIHGWGASAWLWRHLWPEIVPCARCLAPDLPGWGDSEKPAAPYTPEWYADWAAELLDRRFGEAAAVIGHSMGATIALLLALRHPDQVTRLVLCSPIVRGADAFFVETHLLSLRGVRTLAYPLAKTRPVLRWITRTFTHNGRLEQEDMDRVARGTYGSMVRGVLSLKAVDLTPRLAEVRVPARVIVGAEDRLVRPEQAERAAAGIAGAKLDVLPGVGHVVPLEAPEAFNARVVEFIAPATRPFRPPQW